MASVLRGATHHGKSAFCHILRNPLIYAGRAHVFPDLCPIFHQADIVMTNYFHVIIREGLTLWVTVSELNLPLKSIFI